MKQRHSFVRAISALALLVALICQGTLALAGTTGTLNGSVVDSTNKPVKGAKVTAVSPSQIATTTTDDKGEYSFLALAPDTYNVSVEATGFDPATDSGVTVLADQVRTVPFTVGVLKVIGRAQTRAATSLVKPGTTADVYAVDATQQQAVAGVGGGLSLNTAYSAIATIPGVYVPQGVQGGNGIGSNVYIRGGDYDQVGFEIDGVPVNRSFDNYPSGPAASLGQSQLELYTGAAPANAEGQGLAGFINQVIRVGTYPGYASGDAGIGGPAYYHKAGFEVGGATPDRNFSYYAGIDGYNQDIRYADQYNGASLSQLYGVPLAPCPGGVGGGSPFPGNPAYNPNVTAAVLSQFGCLNPGNLNSYGYVLNPTTGDWTSSVLAPNAYFGSVPSYANGGINSFLPAQLVTRDAVFNAHIGLPHKNGLKDDIQLLAVTNFVSTQYYDSANDQGGTANLQAIGLGAPVFVDGYQYSGGVNTALPGNYQSLTSPYFYPQFGSTESSPGTTLPANFRDAISNDQGIFKIQYTHNFSPSALFKLYGYTYYSDWLQVGPQSAYADFAGDASPDYELSSHTRGLSGSFSDQINSQNLLQFQGSYTTSNSLRDNNTQMFNAGGSRAILGTVVSSATPGNGICYQVSPGVVAATPTTCSYSGPASFFTTSQAYSGSILPVSGNTCGGAPCENLVLNNGQYATYNTVKPEFTSFSLTDQFKPNDKLSIDLGLRYDSYQFIGTNTDTGGARNFWYTAFNLDNCLDGGGNLVDKITGLGLTSVNTACPTGYTAVNVTNPSGAVSEQYPVFQPRIGFTYSLNPTTVVRGSYGRYAQAPNSAFEQYNTLQTNAPATLYGTYGFQKFGFTSPDHAVAPEVSNNFDLSFEKSFAGDTSIKLSPFLRTTQNQIQQFYLNQQTGFVSGLNVGKQTSEGFEFELDKGNFARDGLAAKLSFTYTNSYIRYTSLPNGTTVIDPLNAAIQTYNAYTSACAAGGKYAGTNLCGTTSTGVAGAPCYTTAGAAVAPGACTTADVANPYWNAPVQGLLNPSGNYPTFDVLPAGIGSSVAGYGAPYVATLVAQYKKHGLAFTPNVQFEAGQRYGAPLTTYGVAPETCGATLAGSTTGDPRYTNGAAGGAPYDATACTGSLGGIPDPYTGAFDGIGAFVAPSNLHVGMQLSYQATKNLTFVLTGANLLNSCFGGTRVGFSVSGTCGYAVDQLGSSGDIGNTYNPGSAIQPSLNTPYLPTFNLYPATFYLTGNLRL